MHLRQSDIRATEIAQIKYFSSEASTAEVGESPPIGLKGASADGVIPSELKFELSKAYTYREHIQNKRSID